MTAVTSSPTILRTASSFLPWSMGSQKVLGCGVMRGEVRIGQASSPPGFDEAGRPTVQNLKRWLGPVQHDWQGPRPAHGSSSANLGKAQVATTGRLVDRALGQLFETANRIQSSRELHPRAARMFRLCSLSGPHPCSRVASLLRITEQD